MTPEENDEIVRDIKAFNAKWLSENEPDGRKMTADYTAHLIKRWYNKNLTHKEMAVKLTNLRNTMLKRKYTAREIDEIFIKGHRIYR